MFFKGQSFAFGFATGFGAGFVTRDVLKFGGKALQPMVKSLIKTSVRAFDKGRELLAVAGETIEDMVAEARAEAGTTPEPLTSQAAAEAVTQSVARGNV